MNALPDLVRRCLPAFSSVLLLCAIAVTARAQEVEVPVDSAGKVQYIDLELERRIDLFPEFSEFIEAHLYRLPDSSFVLEITYVEDGAKTKKRIPMSTREAENFRRKVSQRIAERSPQTTVDQSGRATFLTGTTLLGLGYYGWAVPASLSIDDGKTIVAVYMLTAGSCFFVPYLLTNHTEVTTGEASLSLYGASMGIVHGYLLYDLFGGDFDNGSGPIGVSVLTGLAESVAGYMVARANRLPYGKVSVMEGVATMGMGMGAATAYLIDIHSNSSSLYTGLMLLGNAGGFVVGNAIANGQPFSAGDATVFNTASVLGAYIPPMLMIGAGMKFDNGRIPIAVTMLGAAGGMWLGDQLVRGREFTEAQGTYVSLGTVAGGALGLGVAYLASSSDADAKIYATASALGVAAGFTVMYIALEDDALVKSETRNWRLDVMPGGVASLALGLRPSASSGPISVATFGIRF